MACILHTGVPGSGKTYLMLHNLVKEFLIWDKKESEYILKEKYKNVTFISNVEGLKIPHENLDDLIFSRVRSLAQKKIEINKIESPEAKEEIFYDFEKDSLRFFFDIDYQKYLSKKLSGNLVYIIEECHRYFDSKDFSKKVWCKDVLDYFREHRHLGHSFYMDTQHVNNITPQLANLFELRFEAKPRSLNLGKAFKYNKICDGQKINPLPIVVKPKKEIFDLYVSMQIDESVKPKSAFIPIFLFISVFAVLSFFLYNRIINKLSPAEVSASPAPVMIQEKNKSVESFSESFSNVSVDKYSWVKIPYYLQGDNLFLMHPELEKLVHVKDFEFKIRRIDSFLYAYCPDFKKSERLKEDNENFSLSGNEEF